jgi:SAM-dependent methyltransferase
VNTLDPDPTPGALGIQRLRRTALYELQTGGGLSLDTLAGPEESAPETALVEKIHVLARALRDLRTSAPARALAALTVRGYPRRVLDLGAGRAPWSVPFAGLDADVEVTAVDLPDELPALRAAVSEAGYADQYRFIAADMFSLPVDLLGSFDLVLVANVCHLFSSDLAVRVIQAAAHQTDDGGRVAIIDQLLDDPPDWNRWSALYAVGLPHLNPGGHLYTAHEYALWFEQLGFVAAPPELLSPAPALSLAVATRL